jgi:hypothetical protein
MAEGMPVATDAVKHPATSHPSSVATKSCVPCERKKYGKANPKLAKALPCHPKGYVDPSVAKNYQKAIRELKQAGIKPKVTSTWRSSAQQAQLHRCSSSRRCRLKNPGLYYALPAGTSMHEAGFAVDISGVATGRRGAKRLTPQGRRIVSVMRKNGFNWRYGLKDPAHFEANPTIHGYRSVKQAIHQSQNACNVKLAKKPGGRYKTVAAVHRSKTPRQ